MSTPPPAVTAATVLHPVPSEHWVNHAQACEACQSLVHFRLCRGAPGFPDFVMPIWPDDCWLGWNWSRQTPSKLDLQVLCSQTCLVQWFETAHVSAPDTERVAAGKVP